MIEAERRDAGKANDDVRSFGNFLKSFDMTIKFCPLGSYLYRRIVWVCVCVQVKCFPLEALQAGKIFNMEKIYIIASGVFAQPNEWKSLIRNFIG